MRILIFHNSGFFNTDNDICVEVSTGNFAKELEVLGHNVTFFGQVLEATEQTTDTFKLRENNIRFVGFFKKKNKVLNYIKLYFFACKEIKKSDFVYFYLPSAWRFLIFFCIVINKKYGIYIRGIDDLKNKINNIFYKYASKIFTVGDYFTNYVNNFSRLKNAENVRPMINFGIDDVVEPGAVNLKDSPIRLLYLGRVTNDKGIVELLHALKHLSDNYPNKFFLNVVGSGEYYPEIVNLCNDLNLASIVQFYGPIFEKNEIKAIYLKSDVFVLGSYHEGFPRTIYEAMTFSIPIVTTFVGGISGLMTNEINCIEILPKSVNSMISVFEGILQNKYNLDKIVQHATEDVKAIYKERQLNHSEALHKSLLKL